MVDPSNNTAVYDYSSIDTIAPQVVSATIIDSITLKVYFSEVLEPGTSQNSSNHIAINGVSVSNANLSSNIVTLTTSIHTPGSYSIIVSNVTDLSGNIIDPQYNSTIYESQPNPNNGLLIPVLEMC